MGLGSIPLKFLKTSYIGTKDSLGETDGPLRGTVAIACYAIQLNGSVGFASIATFDLLKR